MIKQMRSFLIGNVRVRKGNKCLVLREEHCPTCGHGKTVQYIGQVAKLIHHMGTGFAEAGDRLEIHFTNGKQITGDSENGFTGLYPLPRELSWPSST